VFIYVVFSVLYTDVQILVQVNNVSVLLCSVNIPLELII